MSRRANFNQFTLTDSQPTSRCCSPSRVMMNGAAYSLWHSLHCIYGLGKNLCSVVPALLVQPYCVVNPFALCTHQECNFARGLAGEAPFARPKSTHTICCWGDWALTLRGPCSLGPFDHVVASLQQTSASEPEKNQITACR